VVDQHDVERPAGERGRRRVLGRLERHLAGEPRHRPQGVGHQPLLDRVVLDVQDAERSNGHLATR
jgi:hypothetical protein